AGRQPGGVHAPHLSSIVLRSFGESRKVFDGADAGIEADSAGLHRRNPVPASGARKAGVPAGHGPERAGFGGSESSTKEPDVFPNTGGGIAGPAGDASLRQRLHGGKSRSG